MVGVIPIGPFIWTWHADGEPTAAFEIMARPRRQELTKGNFPLPRERFDVHY